MQGTIYDVAERAGRRRPLQSANKKARKLKSVGKHRTAAAGRKGGSRKAKRRQGSRR